MANVLTICRVVLSLALLLVPDALSPAFLVIYALAGVTDMLDGLVARGAGTESELGSRLDSIADYVLVVVSLVRILPVVAVPIWLWVWIALIVAVKAANLVCGIVAQGRPVLPHTTANKVAGLVVFLVPFSIPLVGLTVPAVLACVVATYAAVQEGCVVRWSIPA